MNDLYNDNNNLNQLNITKIRNILEIYNPRFFCSNLNLIYIFLIKTNGQKQLSQTNFCNYFKDIPLVINQRIFNSFLQENKTELSLEDFIFNFMTLMFGNYDEILRLIFNIYDFSKNEVIYKHDVKLLLSYIPFRLEYQSYTTNKKFKLQQESQEELEKMLKLVFIDKSKGLTFKAFKTIINTVNSDIFTILLSYIYLSVSFDSGSVDLCEQYNIIFNNQFKSECLYNLDDFPKFEKPCKYNDYLYSYKLDNQRKESLTPLLMSNKDKDIFDDLEDLDLDQGEENVMKHKKKSSSICLSYVKETQSTGKLNTNNKRKSVTSNNSNNGISKTVLNEDSGKVSKNYITKQSINSSNTCEIKKNNNGIDKLNKTTGFKNFNNKTEKLTKVKFSNENKLTINNDNLYFEVFIPEVALGTNLNNFKLKRLILKLKHTKLFIFKDGKFDKDSCIYICLRNYWISNVESVSCNKLPYFIVNITNFKANKIHSSSSKQSDLTNLKTINLYFTVKENANNFIAILKYNLNQINITDLYDFKQNLGEGSFGLVKYCLNKETKEGVAIKILDKSNLSESKINMINDEISIMKVCCHPNLSILINEHEDLNYIYLVMEYIPGEDLFTYLDQKIILSEDYIKYIMKEVGEYVKYIHNYGIVHRDLKLDNIHININKDDKKPIVHKLSNNHDKTRRGSRMGNLEDFKGFMEKDLSKVELKLIDFGISKVIGNDETLLEPMGTLRFSPPDILTGKPYNCKVDIWSLGVCMYLLFCGDYPFEDECKESTSQRILYDELKFSQPIWNNASKEFIELIKNCLQKDSAKRINIVKFCRSLFFNK